MQENIQASKTVDGKCYVSKKIEHSLGVDVEKLQFDFTFSLDNGDETKSIKLLRDANSNVNSTWTRFKASLDKSKKSKGNKGKNKNNKSSSQIVEVEGKSDTIIVKSISRNELIDTTIMTNNDLLSDDMIIEYSSFKQGIIYKFVIVPNPPCITTFMVWPRKIISLGDRIVPNATFEYADGVQYRWLCQSKNQESAADFKRDLSKEGLVSPAGVLELPEDKLDLIGSQCKVIGTPWRRIRNRIRNRNSSTGNGDVNEKSEYEYEYGQAMTLYPSAKIQAASLTSLTLQLRNQVSYNNFASSPTDSTTNSNTSLRISTYNILADGFAVTDYATKVLFPQIEPALLTAEIRAPMLLREMEGSRSDVLLLQECDARLFREYLYPYFNGLGVALRKSNCPTTNSVNLQDNNNHDHNNDSALSVVENGDRYSNRLSPSISRSTPTSFSSSEDGFFGDFVRKTASSSKEGCACFVDERRLTVLASGYVSLTHLFAAECNAAEGEGGGGSENDDTDDSVLSASWKSIVNTLRSRPSYRRVIGEKLANIAQIIVIVTKDDPFKVLVVVNTHLFYHPDADTHRAMQAFACIYCAQALKEDIAAALPPHEWGKRVGKGDDKGKLHMTFPSHNGSSSSSSSSTDGGGDDVKDTKANNWYNNYARTNVKAIDVGVIFGGDLNSTPDSAAVSLIETGILDAEQPVWENLDVFSWDRREEDNQEDNDNGSNQISGVEDIQEAVPNKVGKEEADSLPRPSLRHGLQFTSACGYPPLTHLQVSYEGCLDWIWIDTQEGQGLEVVSVAPVPSDQQLRAHTALPCVQFPSDHIMISCDVRFKNKNSNNNRHKNVEDLKLDGLNL